MTRFIDPALFDEVAGTDGQLVVVIQSNGGFEIVVPAGAEMREIPIPPEAEVKTVSMSAGANVTHVRSATYYETCIDHFVHVCCNGVCRKKRPVQSC
jgi:hypothetical protein